jgi:A-kinase anchor protein 7
MNGHPIDINTGQEELEQERISSYRVDPETQYNGPQPIKPNFKSIKSSRHPRPDHFLALQVSHSETLRSAVTRVQTSLVQAAPHLSPALVDPATAHITLGVLSLPTDDSRHAARLTLHDAISKVKEMTVVKEHPHFRSRGLEIPLQGLGTFGMNASVLYLHIAQGREYELLQVIANTVRERFASAGLLLQRNQEFVPHVTIAKLSKMKSREVACISPELYKDHIAVDGGVVGVVDVQLCAMGGRPAGEYYRVLEKALLLDTSEG